MIEKEYGYIVYQVYEDKSVYVHELYILDSARKKGFGTKLESYLLKEENPSVIYCDVDLLSNDPETALIAFLLRDYKIDECRGNKIILRKVCQDL